MEQNAKQAVLALLQTYTQAELQDAAQQLLGKLESPRQIPAELTKVLAPQVLHDTLYQLDASVDDFIAKGLERETAYQNKGDLIKRKYHLENEIKLIEADALINNVSADGKTGKVNGVEMKLNNGEQRDAFRRLSSADKRKELAEVEGELAKLDQEAFKAKDAWETVKEAAESVRRKALVQANLLQFLAGGR